MKALFTFIAVLCYASLFSQAGALDSSFGSAGKSVYLNNYPNYFYITTAAAIQKDGKILLTGNGYNYNGTGSRDFAILRLNKDGSIDNNFGNNGYAFIDFAAIQGNYTDDNASSIAVQADGKIVIAGWANFYSFVDSSQTYNYSDVAIARLNTDGTLDNTFNNTGKELIDLSSLTNNSQTNNYSYDYCNGVAVKGNGKIVLAGYSYVNGSNYAATAIQLNSNGTHDVSFANNGILLLTHIGYDDYINSTTVAKDGKIILGGTEFDRNSSSSDILAIRVKGSGVIDSSFGSGGYATASTGGYGSYGLSSVFQPDGKIVEGGYQQTYSSPNTAVLVRFTSNGNLDKSFNGTGINVLLKQNEENQGGNIVLQKDGKIVQTGYQRSLAYTDENFLGYYNFQVLRYTTKGALDSSFGTYGRSLIDFANWTDYSADFGVASVIQTDGKIVTLGSTGTSNPCAARLLTTGRNYGLTGPGDVVATLPVGECTIQFDTLNPILYPDTSLSIVKYSLYNNAINSTIPYDSGYGSVSKKPFNIGSTTVVYTSTIDPLQRAVFNVNVSGGTPAGALDFDGIDDRVDLQYLNPINSYTYGQYSFEGWVKVRGYNKNGGSVIFGDERNNNGGILVELNEKGFITTYQPTVGTVTSKYKVPLNKWTHIAFVQSSTKLDLYVNGKFAQTLLTAPYLHVSTNTNFYLGAYTTDYNTFSRNFNGEMDEIRVWGQAICQGQIQNNLHCELPNYPSGLAAYFNFDQGLASCTNMSVTYAYGGNTSGILQNFALTGPVSNWVAGYVSGTCAVFTPLAITSYPYSVNVQATNDSCSATANFSITASSGCDDSLTISYSQNPNTSFPVGTTYVTATAQDNSGNTQSVYFPVNVTENTPPVLVLKDTSIMLNEYGNAYINPYDLIDTLYDNCTPNYYINVYSSNNYFYCYNAGANSVSVTAYDQSGNSTTKTAVVTILPYAGSATVTAVPNPQQYSDVATLQATLYGAQNFYFNGCSPATDVTFKVGAQVIGNASLSPDYYGNLIATTNYRLADIFPKKVTATFNGLNTALYSLPSSSVSATLNGAPENALVDYIQSQLLQTTTNKATIPVAAQITDTADGSSGDIRKSIVTFTIQPVTAGASVIGSNTITVSALGFVSADHTSGVASGNFNVNTGGNPNAKFNIIVTVSNYYTGTKTVLVYVTKTSGGLIASDNKASIQPDSKSSVNNNDFGAIVSPNPSANEFSLQIKSNNVTDKVSVRISDVEGKILETFSTVQVGETIQLGSKYKPGVYIAEISQATNRKSYKLVKL